MRTGDPGIDKIKDRDFVSIGYIVKTWGIKGDVKVISLTDIPDRYSTLKKVFIHTSTGEKREYFIKNVREVKGGLILSFTPSIPISEAEEIIGGHIETAEGEVPSLGKDSYYHFEIIDIEVYAENGRYIGRIKEILSTGSNDVYVVKDKEREYLIPAIHDVIKEVDIKGKRMVITPMDGLI